MKKRLTVSDTSAPEQGHSTMQGDLFNNSPEIPRFIGTTNPRHLRVIAALLERPLLREELDRVAEYLRILKDPANDDDHPGGSAA
jgi:hypothetical protein